MQFFKTKLEGVTLIKPGDIFEDFRGKYVETYNEDEFRKGGIDVKFVVDDHSRSSRGVLRGIHGDQKTWKLISCLHGRFYFVVVDCREESAQFGQWESFTLTDTNHWQVLVPPRFGNGHLALTDNIIFHYKQSEYFTPGGQFSYRYDDPRFKIWWPIKDPILSQRDEGSGPNK
jgi:dTDP-4-dehydrorhamnose 3,5-epimerase